RRDLDARLDRPGIPGRSHHHAEFRSLPGGEPRLRDVDPPASATRHPDLEFHEPGTDVLDRELRVGLYGGGQDAEVRLVFPRHDDGTVLRSHLGPGRAAGGTRTPT